jgi:HNH endonuclease
MAGMKTVPPDILDKIAAYIRQRWLYNPLTGVVSGRGGKPLGTVSRAGALVAPAYVGGAPHSVLLHRAAWMLQTGEWPIHEVDHANGDRLDNRWCNLREATRSENRTNLAGATAKGRLRGVTPHYNRFKAQIKRPGDKAPTYLGLFATEQEAHDAYCAAKRALHPFNPEQRKP